MKYVMLIYQGTALGTQAALEGDDLDSAIEVAARVPAARYGGAVGIRASEVYW